MTRIRHTMTINICTAVSKRRGPVRRDHPAATRARASIATCQITLRATCPSLVLASASEPRTSASTWYGGTSTQGPAAPATGRHGRGEPGARRVRSTARRKARCARLREPPPELIVIEAWQVQEIRQHAQHLPARPALAQAAWRRRPSSASGLRGSRRCPASRRTSRSEAPRVPARAAGRQVGGHRQDEVGRRRRIGAGGEIRRRIEPPNST